MLRSSLLSLLSLFAVIALVAGLQADDKKKEAKEETLKGTVCCAKCELKKSDTCHTVIKVDDKVYWFDDASSKKYHKDICTESKEGSVKGTVKKKDDKMIVTVTKLEYKK